jgi:polysaccharide biosynthesis/export protein
MPENFVQLSESGLPLPTFRLTTTWNKKEIAASQRPPGAALGFPRNESVTFMSISTGKFGSVILAAVVLQGCSVFGASGPTAGRIASADRQRIEQAAIMVVDVDASVAQRLVAASRRPLFSQFFGEGEPVGTIVGRGDALDVSIWEAPPAVLFGSMVADSRASSAAALPLGRNIDLPEQVVDTSGRITIPFAGSVPAAGRTTEQIERDIVGRLSGKAHMPQAVVRLARNASANATVIGEVTNSARVPLTARGERLLDVIAAAGGVKQAVSKTSIQLTRGNTVMTLPMEQVIRDPSQNVILQPNDVVTAVFQPYSFTALGAVRNNSEVPFEATGLTLSQALGRIGGLDDNRANIRGAFIFRFEDPLALPENLRATTKVASNGRVPVIYRVNLSDPATFFAAQNFPVRDKDIIYVSTAPGADFQKFMNTISSVAFSVIGLSQNL